MPKSKLKAGLIYTRFGKTDGVSLQSLNLRQALERRGFTLYTLSGEAPPNLPRTTVLPLMHLAHPAVQEISKQAFNGQNQQNSLKITSHIESISQELEKGIARFIYQHHFQLLIVFNALTIPMNLPLGLALKRLLETSPIFKILRHYDFYWERERFKNSNVGRVLDLAFPPKQTSADTVHLVLNSIQQKFLTDQYGIKSLILPDTFDYQSNLNRRDPFNATFRKDLGINQQEIVFLQPSRIVPRKRIERTVQLVKELSLPNLALLLTGYAGDEGLSYLKFIQQEVKKAKIKAIWASNRIAFERKIQNNHKIYSLWDAYVSSDFVCLPSDIEGFGNHVVEALYFKKPLFVNNYPVYQNDIAPKGVQAVVINSNLTPSAVAQVKKLLQNPSLTRSMTAHNYQVGKKHFSEKILEKVLDQVLPNLT